MIIEKLIILYAPEYHSDERYFITKYANVFLGYGYLSIITSCTPNTYDLYPALELYRNGETIHVVTKADDMQIEQIDLAHKILNLISEPMRMFPYHDSHHIMDHPNHKFVVVICAPTDYAECVLEIYNNEFASYQKNGFDVVYMLAKINGDSHEARFLRLLNYKELRRIENHIILFEIEKNRPIKKHEIFL